MKSISVKMSADQPRHFLRDKNGEEVEWCEFCGERACRKFIGYTSDVPHTRYACGNPLCDARIRRLLKIDGIDDWDERNLS